MWCDIVERLMEMDLMDKEDEQDDFFDESSAANPCPPELPVEEPPPPPPQAGTKRPPRSQVTKGGNVIPWDGKGTKREVGDRDGFESYPNHLRTSEEMSGGKEEEVNLERSR